MEKTCDTCIMFYVCYFPLSFWKHTHIHTSTNMVTTGEGTGLGTEVVEVVAKGLGRGMPVYFFYSECILPLKLKKRRNTVHLKMNFKNVLHRFNFS